MVTVQKTRDDAVLVMEMRDGENVLCTGTATIDNQKGTIEEIEPLQFGYDMGKALLNSMDLKGVLYVYCKKAHLFELARRLGFQETEDGYRLLLDGYFKAGC